MRWIVLTTNIKIYRMRSESNRSIYAVEIHLQIYSKHTSPLEHHFLPQACSIIIFRINIFLIEKIERYFARKLIRPFEYGIFSFIK